MARLLWTAVLVMGLGAVPLVPTQARALSIDTGERLVLTLYDGPLKSDAYGPGGNAWTGLVDESLIPPPTGRVGSPLVLDLHRIQLTWFPDPGRPPCPPLVPRCRKRLDPPVAVPEPGTLVLMGTGLGMGVGMGLLASWRRRRAA